MARLDQPARGHQLKAWWCTLTSRYVWESHPLKPLRTAADSSHGLLWSYPCRTLIQGKHRSLTLDNGIVVEALIRCLLFPSWWLHTWSLCVRRGSLFSLLQSKQSVVCQCIHCPCYIVAWPRSSFQTPPLLDNSHIQPNAQWRIDAPCVARSHPRLAVLCAFL